MPLDVNAWLLDPEVRLLDDAARGALIDVLARSWIAGKPLGDGPAFKAIWPGLKQLRERHTDNYDARVKAATETNRQRKEDAKRRRSPQRSPSQSPSQSPPRSPPHSPGLTEQSRAISRAEQEQNRTEPSVPSEPQIGTLAALAPQGGGAEDPNWLAAYIEAWVRIRNGQPSRNRIGEMAAELRPLVRLHGSAHVCAAWMRFLAGTKFEDPHPSQFAQNFGRWDGTAITRSAPVDAEKAARAERHMRAVMGVKGGT